jgi:toxin-antitoxin system PIN domain toxin
MTTWLLDVNVLIALLDPAHVQHELAHGWFARAGHASWASCPLTENGVLRIVGNPKYPNSPGSPEAVAPLVTRLRAHPGHVFWPDDASLLDARHADPASLLSAAQITDTYLLALARHHGAKLASLDRRLVTDAVPDGARHLEIIQ